MRIGLVLLPIVFSSAILLGQAEDLALQARVRRLEYIHFDTANQSVEWGVSSGTINEEGKFVPNPGSMATYSIQLQTGQMQHAGQDAQMSRRDSVDASRVFDALALLMQSYTDKWYRLGEVDPSAEEPASELESPSVRLYGIAAQHLLRHRSRLAGWDEPGMAILFREEASLLAYPFHRGAACTASYLYPGLQTISLLSPQ